MTELKAEPQTQRLTISDVDFDDPEQAARFDAQVDAAAVENAIAAIQEARARGHLDENGKWHFADPLPPDMQEGSDCDL